MQVQSVQVQCFEMRDKDAFFEMLDRPRFKIGERSYYNECIRRHKNGEMDIVLAWTRGEVAGFALLNWNPKYNYFKKFGLPEIQDLNVLPDYRRQGIGEKIIRYCEDRATSKKHAEIGIGVGLDSSYGAAQRLYIRLGYIPDGTGVGYDRVPLSFGEMRPNDDDLCLMMTKTLKN